MQQERLRLQVLGKMLGWVGAVAVMGPLLDTTRVGPYGNKVAWGVHCGSCAVFSPVLLVVLKRGTGLGGEKVVIFRHEVTRVSGWGEKAKAGNTEAVGEMPDQSKDERNTKSQ